MTTEPRPATATTPTTPARIQPPLPKPAAVITISISGTVATTSMARPEVGQPMGTEESAAQDVLTRLRHQGYEVQYSAPQERLALTLSDRAIAWLDTHPGHHSSYRVATGMGVDFWLAESLLEQLYNLRRVGWSEGAGWCARALHMPVLNRRAGD